MQVSLETLSGLERRLTIGIPANVVDTEVEKRLREASKNVHINGFRKGKVPMKIVKQRYGAGVRQEVLGDTINRSFMEAVQKESIKPAGQPSIEPREMAPGRDVEFVATFEVYPEFELVGIDGIEIEKLTAEIGEEDVDKMIDILRKSQAEYTKVDRAASDGDRVNIDYVGTLDGEEFAGGKAEEQNLVLGSKSMIPGFESGIEGMSAGEEKTLQLNFPDDYHAEDLKGAEVEFKITLHEVQEQTLPDLDEAFFAKFGVEEGGEERFREDVRKNMENEKSKAETTQIKTRVFDALVEKNPIEIPRALVINEIDTLRRQQLQQYGQIPENIDVRAMLPDDMFRKDAERRTLLGLLVSEVINQEKLKVDTARVREMIENIASTYEDSESVINYYYGNQELLSGIEAAVLEEQVVDLLSEKASVTEKAVTYQELISQRPEDKAQTSSKETEEPSEA